MLSLGFQLARWAPVGPQRLPWVHFQGLGTSKDMVVERLPRALPRSDQRSSISSAPDQLAAGSSFRSMRKKPERQVRFWRGRSRYRGAAPAQSCPRR